MDSLSAITPYVSRYAQKHLSNKITKVAFVICALTSIQMLARSIEKNRNFKNNLGGGVFYGLCATNILPGSAIAGTGIHTVYSLIKGDEEDLLTSVVLIKTCEITGDYVLIPFFEIVDKVAGPIIKQLSLLSPAWYGTACLVTLIGGYLTLSKGLPLLKRGIGN